MTLRTFLRTQGAYIIMIVVIIFHVTNIILYFRSHIYTSRRQTYTEGSYN